MTRGLACRCGAPALALAAFGCELERVTIPPVGPGVAVHGVIYAGRDTQYVVVEHTDNGIGTGGFGWTGMVPDVPALAAIAGAEVRLTLLDPGASCPQATVLLAERPPFAPPGGSTVPSGIYRTDALCPPAAGDRVELEVRTPNGIVVRGVTRVPGIAVAKVGRQRGADAGDTITLDRSHDSLWIDVSGTFVRALQVEVAPAGRTRIPGAEDRFSFVTDSLGSVLAGASTVAFGDAGQPIFAPGRFYALTVAATDTNYFDFARSGSDPFTGRGFINRLDGGIGVFGSVASVTRTVRVVAPQTDPREGLFDVRGVVDGDSVILTWDIYRAPRPPSFRPGFYSAFVRGDWRGAAVHVSIDGSFEPDPFRLPTNPGGASFYGELDLGSADTAVYLVTATPGAPAQAFDADVLHGPTLAPVGILRFTPLPTSRPAARGSGRTTRSTAGTRPSR